MLQGLHLSVKESNSVVSNVCVIMTQKDEARAQGTWVLNFVVHLLILDSSVVVQMDYRDLQGEYRGGTRGSQDVHSECLIPVHCRLLGWPNHHHTS